MITREEALRIAEELVQSRHLGTGVYAIEPFEEIRRKPMFMPVELKHHWIAYVERPISGPRPSLIVAIDRESGTVRYVGSAHDEG